MEPEYFEGEEQTFWSKVKTNFAELIEFIAILGAIFLLFRFFVAEPHRVSGNSMIPNFHNGDLLITNKLPVKFFQLKKGEVIILHNPRNPDQVFIKRLIGFPNEHLKISKSKVYLNNQLLQEPYLPEGTITEGGTFLPDDEELVIPEGQYFVMGDNRGGSSDSREWGSVKKDLIVGQAYFRYWPVNKLQFLNINQPS